MHTCACSHTHTHTHKQPFSFPLIAVNSLYRIRYQHSLDVYYRTVSVSPGTTQTTVHSLQFGSSYSFSIRAEVRFSYCYQSLYGNYSDPVQTTTTESGMYSGRHCMSKYVMYLWCIYNIVIIIWCHNWLYSEPLFKGLSELRTQYKKSSY